MATKEKSFSVIEPIWLHTGYLAFAHTSLAQIISLLSTLHSWFQLKGTSFSGELMKFVFISLTFPVF